MKKVIEKRPDIVFYIKLFPLVSIHPKAYEKSKAINCSKSLAVLEDAYEKKPVPDAKCESSEIDNNMKLAEKLGIDGTPAMIFPDGSVVSGGMDADSMIAQINKKP